MAKEGDVLNTTKPIHWQDKKGAATICKVIEDIADYTELSPDTIKRF